MEFRTLRADEIECRVGMIKDNGFSLLLYKDARCELYTSPFIWIKGNVKKENGKIQRLLTKRAEKLFGR